jgi:SARP family transcriptional regulator, regulator of embCAB operon
MGPLRVVDAGATSTISAPKIETLLTVLLIWADRLVANEQLMTEIWGGQAPRRASAGLHVYVSQLRKFLHRPDRRDSPIATCRSGLSGYLLRMGADELDIRSFHQLASAGRALAGQGRHAEASDRFEQALGLWRGPVLNGAARGPIVRSCTTWLAETHLECQEMLVDAQLRLGLHRALVGRLQALTAEYPLHETFCQQLMLALFRSGRQADALRVYESARRIIRDELGLEPCQGLRDLQRGILTADAQL